MATMSFQVPEPEQPQFFAPPPKMGSQGTFELMKEMPDGHQNVPTEVLLPEMSPFGSQRFHHALSQSPGTGRHYEEMMRWTYDQENLLPVEFRPAVPTIFGEDGRIQFGTKLAYWLRARGSCPGSVNRQRAILGFHIDQFMLGNIQANIKESSLKMMASLDHTMWFHNDFTMSQWLLMVVRGDADIRWKIKL